MIRTSSLYSAYSNNFVKIMSKLGNDRDELGIIFDQVGIPTNASYFKENCLYILSS